MLGTDFSAPGGITAVIRSYRDARLFAQWPIRFLPTYRRNGVFDKLLTASLALVRFVFWLFSGQMGCVHAHVAARGSFWRKSIFLKLAIKAGVKTIFHLHDGSFPDWYAAQGQRTQEFVREMFRGVDRVVVLTETWKNWVLGIEPSARVVVIGNPVSLPDRSSSRQPGKLLFLGRLREEKGIFDLLQALALLKSSHPDLVLTCAGDGDLDDIRQRARALGVDAQLHLPGWIEGADKEGLLADASIFVLPSYFEGLPVGVLEAMAYGIPVVATEVGGVRDALGNEAGLLIAPGDIEGLAAAIRMILDNLSMGTAMGQAGRERVRTRYETNLVMQEIGRLYADLSLSRYFPNPQCQPGTTV